MAWLNCGVTSQTIWPEKQMEVKYGENTFVLMPRTRENSASIHIELNGISPVEGRTLLKRFLSALCWKNDQPAILHYGWSGNVVPCSVPKYGIPYGYSPSDSFPKVLYEIKDEKAKLAIALYREALSLDSVPYSFLSYFKILNVFWPDKYKNGANQLVEGLRDALETLQYEEDIKRVNAIKGKHGDPAAYLYNSGRCAVAHAYSDPIVDPDDVTDLRRLSEDLPLMRSLTAQLINEKFDIEQSIWA